MRRSFQLRADPLVVLAVVMAVVWGYLSTEAKLEPAAAVAPGRLVFMSGFHDLGTVTEGDIVKHTFTFLNKGSGTVKILKTETSCGCTTASGALKAYAPGERGEMEVVVDTKGKKGIVVKTVKVTLENDVQPFIELSLSMDLVPPPHPKIGNIRNINADKDCKTCHLESGEGQSGVFLYHRVCSQCHGKKGVGGFGRAFADAVWQRGVTDGYLRERIVKGWLDKGMPSFVEGVTPPLDGEQVESLVAYIRKLGQ